MSPEYVLSGFEHGDGLVALFLRVEPYQADRLPVACPAGPPVWRPLSGIFINRMPFSQDLFFKAIMPVVRGHKPNRAMQMLRVVPLYEDIDPGLGLLDGPERF